MYSPRNYNGYFNMKSTVSTMELRD